VIELRALSASLAVNHSNRSGDGRLFVGSESVFVSSSHFTSPAWLIVSPNGTLSCTSAVADIGAKVFTVSLADRNGWASAAAMNIASVTAPLLVSTSSGQNNSLVLSWTGGQPPYQVQMVTGLINPSWQNLGGPVSPNTLLLTPFNAVAF